MANYNYYWQPAVWMSPGASHSSATAGSTASTSASVGNGIGTCGVQPANNVPGQASVSRPNAASQAGDLGTRSAQPWMYM